MPADLTSGVSLGSRRTDRGRHGRTAPACSHDLEDGNDDAREANADASPWSSWATNSRPCSDTAFHRLCVVTYLPVCRCSGDDVVAEDTLHDLEDGNDEA